MNRIIKIALIVIGLISAVLWFSLPEQEDPGAISNGALNGMFIIMYILLAIAVVVSLFFGIKKLLSTKGSLKKALFAIGGLLIVVAISYGLSSTEEADAVVKTFERNSQLSTDQGTVKTIGMGLNVFFILTVVAIVLMLGSNVKKLIGK